MRPLLILSLNTAQIKCTSLFLNFLHLQPRPSTFNQHFQTYLLRNIHLLCFALLGLAWLSFAFLCFRFPPVRAEDLLKSVVQHYNITALACRHFFCEIWSSRAEEWNSSLTTLRCVARDWNRERHRGRSCRPGALKKLRYCGRNVIDLVTYYCTCL